MTHACVSIRALDINIISTVIDSMSGQKRVSWLADGIFPIDVSTTITTMATMISTISTISILSV